MAVGLWCRRGLRERCVARGWPKRADGCVPLCGVGERRVERAPLLAWLEARGEEKDHADRPTERQYEPKGRALVRRTHLHLFFIILTLQKATNLQTS